ncbi:MULTISPECIES: acyltransferase family protein [unclassified Tolypothrix]|uniref:acyltransferase family protein n=1 Tax=unclassified Tolypothrix TaxID=2649714 RepID=UPI0005EAAD0A|nr:MULTISPECIES: acyltransferase family protein [unclassified Tolypothrix]BAY93094.1 hypothetical protein NIES3275_51310 [Microchaete diplosiphon NIES-3275]EKF00341.1 hypothetical protein FDUTEX481_09002 [Tolypothrix sp. PCC 7601]MBE9081885.1 acyltransferase family protein [Tolypothrix sp. LEGE 11397]UYD26973.1 acyltransferase family protein [Tolypothrix sp. PCC 7712]UYD37168.1 acyltransferase family protein [Tolypothrix sp. PCC 7601]
MRKTLINKFLSDKSSSQQKANRLFSLDLLKAMSIIAVVSFHSILVPRTTYADNGLAIDILFSPLRFCVPVFLTISFLLMEKRLVKQTSSTWDAIYKRLNRLLIPTLFWFTIAGSFKIINHNPLLEVIATIFNQIIGSICLHLFAESSFNFLEIMSIKLVSCLLLLSISLGFSILLDKIGLKAVVR